MNELIIWVKEERGVPEEKERKILKFIFLRIIYLTI